MKDGIIDLEKGKEVIVSMTEVEGTPEKFCYLRQLNQRCSSRFIYFIR